MHTNLSPPSLHILHTAWEGESKGTLTFLPTDHRINNDLDSFLHHVTLITEAMDFFADHPNFKGADKLANVQLKALKEKAISKLEGEFRSLLNQTSKKEIDPFTVKLDEMELIPRDKLEQLYKIAKRLDDLGTVNYKKMFKETRSIVLKKIVNKIIPEKKTQIIPNLTAINTVVQRVAQVQSKPTTTKESWYYKKGTHSLIFLMNFYLKLVEAEQKITQRVLFGQQANPVFRELIQHSMDVFISRTSEQFDEGKDPGYRILVLFDVLANMESTGLKGFEQTLGSNTSQYEKIQQMYKTLKASAWQLLQEFNSRIQQNQLGVFAEGIVHEATSLAFSFLKKLLEYQNTVERLLPDFFGDDSKKDEKTLVGRYISKFFYFQRE